MNAERALASLRRLGLSDYEARAYTALLAVGQLTPAEVSRAANIPYTKVYEVLRRLERKGWVLAVSRSPLVYAPVRPEEALSRLRREFEGVLSEAAAALRALEEEGAGVALAGVYVLRSFEALARAARGLAADAGELLVVASDPRLLGVLEPLLPGKRVRGLLEAGIQPPGHGEWRRAQILLALDMVVADREKLLLHFGLLSRRGGLSGVLVSDGEIAGAAASYFERMWEIAGAG